MKKIVWGSIMICCYILPCNILAQVPILVKEWEVMLGSQGEELNIGPQYMMQDKNGDVYIMSTSLSNAASGNKTDPNCYIQDSIAITDMWLVKIDTNGNILWNRTLGGELGEHANCIMLNSAKDKIIVTGGSNSDMSCEKTQNRYDSKGDTWTLELDLDSNIIWDKRYGSKSFDVFYNGATAPDGSVLIGGFSNAYAPNKDVSDSAIGILEDIWLVKIDSAGNKIWDQKYGSFYSEFPYEVIALSNEQYLLLNYTNGQKSGDVSDSSFSSKFDPSYFKGDNWLLKIDSSGKKIWDKRYGCLKAEDHPNCGMMNSDGEVVIGASLGLSSLNGNFYPCNDGVADTTPRGAFDAWLYKIDTSDGHIIKEKRFGGELNDAIMQIIELSDKGYLIALKSNSNASFEKSENRIGTNLQNTNNYDIWLVRMDSAFNILWDKTLGTDGYDDTPNIIALSDSTFILAAKIKINNNDVGIPMFDTANYALGWPRGDIWVAKWFIANPAQVDELNLASINLYPNPALDLLYITLQNPKNKNYQIQIHDMHGRKMEQKSISFSKSNSIMIETQNWPPGVYVVNIESVSKKVVKL